MEKSTKSAAGNDFSSSARSHTTLIGIDCEDFLILGSEARTTEIDGFVDKWDFVKHFEIVDMVYIICAGDTKLFEKFAENLRGMVLKNDYQGVDYVAEVASKLLEKTCIEEYLLKEEMTPVEQRVPRNAENVDQVLHILLAGKSGSGFHVYTIDDVNGPYTHRKVSIAFGGSGITHARVFASKCYVDRREHRRENEFVSEHEAVSFAKDAIEDATHKDWRSGGRIHILIIFKKKKKSLAKKMVVYTQVKRETCTCPYVMNDLEEFVVKRPVGIKYPKGWELSQLENKLVNLKATIFGRQGDEPFEGDI